MELRLLYFEHHKYIVNAIAREKQIKGWSRAKKIKNDNRF
jgi:putative endonuclease